MIFAELLTEAKKLSLPDQIRLATELLQSVTTHWLPTSPILPSTLPDHPFQNLSPQEYEQKLNDTFQSIKSMTHDQELAAIFVAIDQERDQDQGRNLPEWE